MRRHKVAIQKKQDDSAPLMRQEKTHSQKTVGFYFGGGSGI
jgi:hypothetical protein